MPVNLRQRGCGKLIAWRTDFWLQIRVLRNNPVEIPRTSWELPILLIGICGIYSKLRENNQASCNWLNLEALGSWPIVPRNLPGWCTVFIVGKAHESSALASRRLHHNVSDIQIIFPAFWWSCKEWFRTSSSIEVSASEHYRSPVEPGEAEIQELGLKLLVTARHPCSVCLIVGRKFDEEENWPLGTDLVTE